MADSTWNDVKHEPRLGWRMAGDYAELFLYDVFDPVWGIATRDVVVALDDLANAAELHVHVSSPGGDTITGIDIMNAVGRVGRQRFGRVVSFVDGAGYSAATLPTLAGDETVMMPGSLWFVHRPRANPEGNAEELLDAAGVLERIEGQVADLYARRTGATVPAMIEAMTGSSGKGTYYTPEEAVEAGFADRVEHTQPPGRTASEMRFPPRANAERPPAVRAAMRQNEFLRRFLDVPRSADQKIQAQARETLAKLKR